MPKIVKTLLVILFISGLISLLFHYFPDVASRDNKYNIMYYMLLLSTMGGSFALRFKRDLSGSLKHLAIWVLIFMAFIAMYGLRNDLILMKDKLVAELLPSQAVVTKEGTLEFRVSSDGHYHINTLVNGSHVRFILDTGASDVVLPQHIAKELGFDIASLQFTKFYNTANGQGRGAPITIETLQIGDFRFHDIRASVNEAEMDAPLLGMSFLEKLSGYQVENGVLTIKP